MSSVGLLGQMTMAHYLPLLSLPLLNLPLACPPLEGQLLVSSQGFVHHN